MRRLSNKSRFCLLPTRTHAGVRPSQPAAAVEDNPGCPAQPLEQHSQHPKGMKTPRGSAKSGRKGSSPKIVSTKCNIQLEGCACFLRQQRSTPRCLTHSASIIYTTQAPGPTPRCGSCTIRFQTWCASSPLVRTCARNQINRPRQSQFNANTKLAAEDIQPCVRPTVLLSTARPNSKCARAQNAR